MVLLQFVTYDNLRNSLKETVFFYSPFHYENRIWIEMSYFVDPHRYQKLPKVSYGIFKKRHQISLSNAEVFPKLLFFVGRLPVKEMFINRVEYNVHNIVFILHYIWSVIIFFFKFLFSPGKSPEKRICLFTKSIRNLLSLDFDPIKIFHQCFNR